MKKGFLLFLLAGNLLYGQNNNPFLQTHFDKVIMYDFEPGGSKGGSIVESDGKLTNKINKEVELKKKEIQQLNSRLSNPGSFNFGAAACFDPHLGFVFYRGTKIVGHITICVECNAFSSSLPLPSQNKKAGLASGMSKEFRRFLNKTMMQYKFSHLIPPGSTYDQ